jgi:Secretion system C-terminal sorting domain
MYVAFSGPSTVTKNFYYNTGGCYKEQYNVTLNPGCRTTSSEPHFSTTIFPNPAMSNVTVLANETKISSITLTDFMNFTVKQIKAKGQKMVNINITDLKPGVYNCQIVTEKGIENHKLIIKQ